MQVVTAHGARIPLIGLGTWALRGRVCARMVEQAIRLGYRHIDTAEMYDNEREAGEGLRAAGVKRDEVFVTTKVWPSHFAPRELERAAKDSLTRLRLSEVDLLLLHWPNPRIPLSETLGALCKVKQAGVARHIGVSNFTVALIEEAVAPHRDFDVAIKVRLAVAATREPVVARNPAILYGVGNILENAVDFARTTVEVNAWWNADTVEIIISDDGPGIAPDMLKRIGEPYLSRRRSADEAHRERAGLGLGVFIARTLLERTGAKVSFSNRTFPDHGAVVQIAWPRARFETDESPAGPAD